MEASIAIAKCFQNDSVIGYFLGPCQQPAD